MNDKYERFVFPQTVRCVNCGDKLPSAVTCWMVNGHIHCTTCKDKFTQQKAQRSELEGVIAHFASGPRYYPVSADPEWPAELDV